MGKMLGVMLDCSRNAVTKPEKVKQFASIIRKMGYNTLMLYTEETYEIESQPYFGHLRGRYSCEELRDIDKYCNEIGIELVPCIQTLAHLNQMFKWVHTYSSINDCDSILFTGEDKTYALIEDMIKTAKSCFTSKKIHIGMDEAYRVGSGKYADKHGNRDRFDVINEHLHKVCDITRKYGLEPMIWSDMFCKLAAGLSGFADQYGKTDTSKILEKAALPEDISLVYWDYYNEKSETYAYMIERNKLFDRNVFFAGGAWAWFGFAPYNGVSIRRTDAALTACMESRGVDGVFFTVWGDDGAECSSFTILPTLMFAAERLKGNTDMVSIKEKFRNIVGVDFDTFMMLDELNTPGGNHSNFNAACKYLLYNDVFMGIRDSFCLESDGEYYSKLADKIAGAEKNGYEDLFDSYEKLCRVLEYKASLGIRTRKAYLEKNNEALKEIAVDYSKTIDLLNDFHAAFQKRWFDENKPHGFDIQDVRIGGLIQRIKSCKDRIEKYLSGEISDIPELSEPVLPLDNGTPLWKNCVSANVISH